MFKIFLEHQWKEFWRGRNKAGSLAAKIFMMIIVAYFLLLALGLGFFMKQILKDVFPSTDPIQSFNGVILYYFLADFLMRIQLQELPTLSIQPYLTINIRKKVLINFLNGKALMSFFNVAPLIVFLPFCLTTIASSLGAMATLGYIVTICSLILFNNFLLVYTKRKANDNLALLAGGLVAVLVLGALDYFKIISISALSNLLFQKIAQYPFLALVFTGIALLVYRINTKFLYSNLFLEEMTKKEAAKTATDYPFLNRFGEVGQLAALELKLILRHKRSKSAIMMSFAFVLYGFFFYKPEFIAEDRFAMMMFAAIFMTGIFQIAYGQYMFAWQSAHFDGLMANRINYKNFIRAKFLLFTIAATLVTMLTMFYGIMSWKLIVLHLVIYLYNIGFGAVIVLFFANYNKKRLDLSKGGTFNWQGVGATQWILGIPLIALPFLIYLPFGINNQPFWGLIAIGLFGLLTLSLRELWVSLLTKLFSKQRYSIAEGFRE